jgi:hypothetical protein
MHKTLTAAALAAVAAFAPAPAAAADVAAAFGKGSTQVFVTAGSGYAFDQTYFVLGLGATYYLVDGLGLGLSLESWSGADPNLYKVTPSVQYVFRHVPVVKPYVGVFYRRTYVSGLSDLDSAGGRAGVYIAAGRNAYVGAGAVYEYYIDCNTAVYGSCSSTYPELSFTIAF